MPLVDVRPFLRDPADAIKTTDDIDALCSDVALDGGGTLFFSAGEYAITNRLPADLDQAYRIQDDSTQGLDNFHQGGIRLRAGVSLQGEPGTRLLATPRDDEDQGNCVVIGSDSPFIWVPGSPGHLVEAFLEEDVEVGDTTFVVDDSSPFAAGDEVIIRLRENQMDHPEVHWWAFAKVTSVASPSAIES